MLTPTAENICYTEALFNGEFIPPTFDKVYSEKHHKLISMWIMGKDLSKFGLDAAQQEFVLSHDLDFSTAYIGMVRCYHKNKTIWQTSCFASIFKAIDHSRKTEKEIYDETLSDYTNLSLQVKEFVVKLMELSDKELSEFLNQSQVGLFSN